MYEVILMPDAMAFYRRAQPPLAGKLKRCFANLSQNPHGGPNVKPLTGHLTGIRRYRLGDWRVLYQIDDQRRVVQVLVIAHRREVYR